MEKTSVLIPYISASAKAEELRYALRSIAKHLKGNYEIILIGDKPDYVSDEVIHIPHQRATGGGIDLPKCNDAWNKILTAINSGLLSKVFVYTYDDICLLEDVEPMQLRKLYAEEDLHKVEKWNEEPAAKKHVGMIKKTLAALAKRGLPGWNYETHLPKVLNAVRVKRIAKEFNGQKNRLLLNLLYGNYYYKGLEPQLLEKGDKVKVAFTGKSPKSYSNRSLKTMLKACEGAKFLNWNDAGYNQNVEDLLKELFPDKCRFEV
jgi:hypothetical protein